MKFWKRLFFTAMGVHFFCPPDEGGGAGAGAGDQGDKGKSGGAPDAAAELAAAKARIAELEGKLTPPKKDDDDLNEKARKAREAADKDSGRIKRMETSIAFNMKAPDFLKANAGLLPKDVEEIFKQADKETYDDQTQKADAMKAGLVQSFFNVQENVDLLTPGQKAQLDEYLKLTKTGKQDKAQNIYEMIFEPALEMLKRTKKAAALNRGLGDGTDESYRDRLKEAAMKHYRMENKQ